MHLALLASDEDASLRDLDDHLAAIKDLARSPLAFNRALTQQHSSLALRGIIHALLVVGTQLRC